MINRKNIAVIGCGNLGLSLVNGLRTSVHFPSKNLVVTRRNTSEILFLEDEGITVTDDNIKAVKQAEIILFALKPFDLSRVLKSLTGYLIPGRHILVSLATGISIKEIKKFFSDPVDIFRAVPNTAADVGASITAVCTTSDNKAAAALVRDLFNQLGNTVFLEEDLIDSSTVLNACGIAYALRFIRAMIQGGIQIGFDSGTAASISVQTVLGAAELLLKRNQHPEFEIDKVTTPRGYTIAGLNEMEHHGFSSALIKGIVTSFEKMHSDKNAREAL
ncbi:MAG: pyrroline-5-carboxylate reductase [Bacteroidales bacterium]|nr:pyrroline-5-carboxylate reductase [Bacteroidales bacterium]